MKSLLFAAILAVTLPGCIGGQNIVRDVSAIASQADKYITNAQEVLNIARAAVSIFMLAHPSPDAQAKIEKAFAAAHLGIDAASQATRGVNDLTQEQFDRAWEQFRVAYRQLEALLKETGVLAKDGKLAASPGMVTVPEPLAMRVGSK